MESGGFVYAVSCYHYIIDQSKLLNISFQSPEVVYFQNHCNIQRMWQCRFLGCGHFQIHLANCSKRLRVW
jgi:hypothetical protein